MVTSIRLDSQVEQRLDFLARQTGRTKAYYLRQIIEHGLEEIEDYYLAAEVLEKVRKGQEPIYSAADVRADLGLTIDYTDTARRQLRKLDKPAARRIIDYMDERVAPSQDPRSTGKALTGPLGNYWRYRVGEYRVICDIQDGYLRVLVVQIGNRREVYR